MWDERFSTSDFVFGTAPAAYLVAAADHLDKGSRVLCVADGEGRNSVYLAGLGHEVTAFDASAVGIEKAKGLAAKQGVSVDYRLSGVEDWDWTRPYDAVVAIFIQFMPPDMRARIFDGLRQAVRPA